MKRFRLISDDGSLKIILEDDKGNIYAVAEKLDISSSDKIELESFFTEVNISLEGE